MTHDEPLCASCGACCTGPVPVDPGDALPHAFVRTDANGRRWMKQKNLSIECAAFDANARRCTIYDNRPTVCRQYPVDGVACRKARAIASARPVISVRVLG